MMPEHGDFDDKTNKWFCSYWQNEQEWYEIHNYPPNYNDDDYDLTDDDLDGKSKSSIFTSKI